MRMAAMIKVQSGHDGFEFGALHAEPQGPRRGGVIVIQEIFGLDKYVHEDVARWSALGFEVLAPSMFDRGQPGFLAEHDPEGVQAGARLAMANGRDNSVSDIQACIDVLKARGPVFIVGYCYGGTMVWLAASACTGLAAGSSYYGGQVPGMVGLPLSCPVQIHLGRKDAHIPADEVKAKVIAAHPDVEVFIYENSGHGFNNDGRPDSDLADAQLARKRSLALFEANGAA
jgi:carboxymethylenebutenolidase